MDRKDYTLEVYVVDRRTKKGERLFGKYDYKNQTEAWMKEEMRDLASGLYPAPKYRFELHETMVEVTSIFGQKILERYDTPFHASPSSETYWCS